MDRHLDKLKQALQSAIADMSNAQLLWHPQEKWCAAEILEHLYLTYTGTTKGFQKVLQAGAPPTLHPSLKQRWQILVVNGFHYLPTGRKSPPMAQPKGLPLEKVKNEFENKIAEMDVVIADCEARFGKRVRLLNHPVLGPLTGQQWRKFHLVHGLHHEKQLLQLRDAVFTAPAQPA